MNILLYSVLFANLYLVITKIIQFMSKNRESDSIVSNLYTAQITTLITLAILFIIFFFPFGDPYLMRGVPRIILFFIGLELLTVSVLDIYMIFSTKTSNKIKFES